MGGRIEALLILIGTSLLAAGYCQIFWKACSVKQAVLNLKSEALMLSFGYGFMAGGCLAGLAGVFKQMRHEFLTWFINLTNSVDWGMLIAAPPGFM